MESEIGLQFFPQPIDKPVCLDRAKIAGSEPLGLFDVAIQAVEICEQKRVVDAGYPTIFLAFQKPNRSADIPSRQRACK